jgi:hypothetical protein
MQPFSETEDSPLMRATLAAARFMVEMREATKGSITDDKVMEHFQGMLDTHVIDIMAATVTMTIELIVAGKLKRQADYPPPAAEKGKIILPSSERSH